MGSYFDLAITQPILRLGLKIMIFLKSELNGLLKMPQIALLHISEAEKYKKCLVANVLRDTLYIWFVYINTGNILCWPSVQ